MEKINYKKLWFEVCEEKKQLQLENYRIKKELNYITNKFESLDRIHSSMIQKNWNKYAPDLNLKFSNEDSLNSD